MDRTLKIINEKLKEAEKGCYPKKSDEPTIGYSKCGRLHDFGVYGNTPKRSYCEKHYTQIQLLNELKDAILGQDVGGKE